MTGGLSAACTDAVKINANATGRQMKPLKKWDRLIVNDFMKDSLVSLFEFDVYPLSRDYRPRRTSYLQSSSQLSFARAVYRLLYFS